VSRYLAVAHQTANAGEFIEALKAASGEHPQVEVVLLVPATPVKHLATWTQGESRAVALKRALAARRTLEEAGINVTDARIGDPDPYQAIIDALADGHFDHVIVSTFPPGVSRWLGADLINRLQRSIGVPVTHVMAH
jgi:hypothetical protein